MSPYEQHALEEIHAWKHPRLSWFGKTMRVINWPMDKVGDMVMDTPGVGTVLKRSIQGLTGVCNDLAQWSVQQEAIYTDFRKSGHAWVRQGSDILALDLEEVDQVVSWLDTKYKGVALGEGGTTGAAGVYGIPVDLVALISMNLRAIGEYATYYGFSVASQEERLFAMNVLGLASSPSDSSKALAMAQLVRIARDVARKKTWKELEKHAFVQVIQQMAKALGIRLTKAKLAQFLPALGAFVGAGYNTYFTNKVCDAAYHLYRERFLAEKYGADVIEITVEPAQSIDPGYPEEDEDLPE